MTDSAISGRPATSIERLAPIKLQLDEPGTVVVRGMPFSLSGWIVSTRPIEEVSAKLDGRLLGSAELGLPRPDVGAANPTYPKDAASGFRVQRPAIPEELPDEIVLSVEARANDGTRAELTRRVAVVRLDEAIAGLGAALRHSPDIYIRLAEALVAADRRDEADALLSDAIEYFPDDVRLRLRYAQSADARRAWNSALARWTRFREQWPDKPHGHLHRAVALHELHRLDEAEREFRALMTRFPITPEIRFHYSRLGRAKAEVNLETLDNARGSTERPRQTGETARNTETRGTTPTQLEHTAV